MERDLPISEKENVVRIFNFVFFWCFIDGLHKKKKKRKITFFLNFQINLIQNVKLKCEVTFTVEF